MKYLSLVFLLLHCITAVYASDLAREKRLTNEIIDSIMDGEAVFLESADHKFLSIYMESESEQPKGAAIIMHGRGFHPDWADVVRPLRTGLPEAGWHTLSLQMPVLAKTAKYYDYVPIFQESFLRIDAAIHFLKAKGISNIVLIAHSCSVHMSMAWFEDKQVTDVSAYIGIGMGATDYKQPMAHPFALHKLKLPILDIYGSEDYPAVKNQAADRLNMIKKAGHQKSKQQAVAGANHYFTDQGDKLLKAINSWLDTL